MFDKTMDRRQFMLHAGALAGGVLLAPGLAAVAKPPSKRTAADTVTLGRTGIKLSRLGMGTGSRGGKIQRDLGQDGFTKLVRHAYDQGIRYIDTADNYKMHGMVGKAIKGLKRETLYIQSKMWGVPDKPLAVLDRFRRELGVEYIDSLLLHCVVRKTWDRDRRKVMDALAEAKRKKIIRAHGFSSHSQPGVARGSQLDWVDVALVRINPQGVCIDTPAENGRMFLSNASHVKSAVAQIRKLHDRKKGVIGMKLIGDGRFTKPRDRDRAIRFAMQCGLLDAVVIGFKSTGEIDEAVRRINAALAEASVAAA